MDDMFLDYYNKYHIPEVTLDVIICEIYKEFEEKNKDLLKLNTIEYWRLASRYKEQELRKRLYSKQNL